MTRRTKRPSKALPPPVKSFKSSGGRRFTVSPGERQEREGFASVHWDGDAWPILYRGKQAGTLFRSPVYTRASGEPGWHASLHALRTSKIGFGGPIGIGFDVAAFDTAGECLAAWARNADDVLDFAAGKPVKSIYAGGVVNEQYRGKPGYLQRKRAVKRRTRRK